MADGKRASRCVGVECGPRAAMSVTSGVVGDSDDQYHPYIYIVKRRGETQNEGHPKGLSQFNL